MKLIFKFRIIFVALGTLLFYMCNGNSNKQSNEPTDSMSFVNVSDSSHETGCKECFTDNDLSSQKTPQKEDQDNKDDVVKTIYNKTSGMEGTEGFYANLEELYKYYKPDLKMADIETPDSVILTFMGEAETYIIARKGGEGSIKTYYIYNNKLVHYNKISKEENDYILNKCGEICFGPNKTRIIKLRKRIRDDVRIIVEYFFPWGLIEVYNKGKKLKPIRFTLRVEDEDGIVTIYTKDFLDLIAFTQGIILRENHGDNCLTQSLYDWADERFLYDRRIRLTGKP